MCCTLHSPIIDAVAHPFWRDDVEATFAYLEKYFDVSTLREGSYIAVCVHPTYSLTELKRISQAAIHFEETLDNMIPRTNNQEFDQDAIWGDWRTTSGLAHHHRKRIHQRIESTQNVRDLALLMHEAASDCQCWMFYGMITPESISRGYLCWVRPPGLHNARLIIEYTTLAVAFVEAAIEFAGHTLEELLQFTPDPAGLSKFLSGQGHRSQAEAS